MKRNWKFFIPLFLTLVVCAQALYLGHYAAQATVSTTAPRNDYIGNGATATYSYTFRIFSSSDLRVTKRDTSGAETALILTTDYTVTGVNRASGGTITLLAGNLPSGYTLTIRFDRTPQQSTDLRNQGSFFAETHETKFDELTRYIQALTDVVDRSLHLPETEVGTDAATTLPSASLRAGQFMAFDANGNVTTAAGTSGDLSPVSGYMNGLLAASSAASARSTLDVPSTAEAVLDSLIDAKGDLIGGSADNTPARVAASSTNGLVLTANSGATPGVSWSFPAMPNPIINGNMEVWQRGTSFVSPVTGTYTADRFVWNVLGAGMPTINRSTDVPTVAQAGTLLTYSLELDVTTADTSIAANDQYILSHRIEGYNWRPFAQQTFTLSFWVRDTKTGEHAVSFVNSGNDRSYVAAYNVNVSDTWEFKTITVSASPSAGTWDYTTGIGLAIRFPLATGSNFTTTTANAWNVGNFMNLSTTVNSMDSTSNFFRVTGIKLERGTVATPIQFVPFEQELARAQRYYQKSFLYGTAPVQNAGLGTQVELRFPATTVGATTSISPTLFFPVLMRANPTITLYNPSAANAQVRNATDSADCSGSSFVIFGPAGFALQATGNAGMAVGEMLAVNWASDAEL